MTVRKELPELVEQHGITQLNVWQFDVDGWSPRRVREIPLPAKQAAVRVQIPSTEWASFANIREAVHESEEREWRAQPIGEEGDSHLGDFVQDRTVISPAEAVINMKLKEQTAHVLHTLCAREEKVVKMRSGLEDGSERTLRATRRHSPNPHLRRSSGLMSSVSPVASIVRMPKGP